MKLFLKISILATLVIFLPSATASYQITFAWDANTEPDIAGYVLYGKQGSPCPPYDYIDTYPVEELADPLNPKCVLTGLDPNLVYYFVITAYDTAGNESDYSDILSSEGKIASCSRAESSGGGGGCFITDSAYGIRQADIGLAIILFFIFFLIIKKKSNLSQLMGYLMSHVV